MLDRNELIAIIAKAIRDVRIDCPAIEPGVAHESVPFAKAALDALDGAGLEVVEQRQRAVPASSEAPNALHSSYGLIGSGTDE
jgi:hypothetical protein